MSINYMIRLSLSYLASREAQGADGHGLIVQLDLLNDEHLSIVVNGLVYITVVYKGTRKEPVNNQIMSTLLKRGS